MTSDPVGATDLVEQILADPPRVHDVAPEGVWRTHDDCYRFIADHVKPGARTVETGCGVSTVIFTALGCDHLCVVPFPEQEQKLRGYLRERAIDDSSLAFDLQTSDRALPQRLDDGPLDAVFIDGSHGFPQALIDWYYTASRLRRGGIVVIDDIWLRNVTAGLLAYLEADPRWEHVSGSSKWVAYRRASDGSLCEEWTEQRFFVHEPSARLRHRVARALPPSVRDWMIDRRQRFRARRAEID